MTTELNSTPIESLWTVKEVAAFLRLSPSWVYLQVEKGLIPHRRFGASVRFDPQAVREWALRPVATVRPIREP